MKNHLALFVIAAMVASATAASASMYDDAFSQDVQAKTSQAAQAAAAAAAANQAYINAVQAYKAAAAAPADIMGSYETFDGKHQTSNHMTLTRLADGNVSFSIEREGMYGTHPSCSIDGVAKKVGDQYVFVDPQQPMFGAEHYRMVLTPKSDRIELSDNGAGQYYCGAAMELNGAYFRFSDRTK